MNSFYSLQAKILLDVVYPVYTEQTYGIAIPIAILILKKCAVLTLDHDRDPLKFDPTYEVDHDADRSLDLAKVCHVILESPSRSKSL